MSTVIDEGYTDVEEATDFYWRLTAPVGTGDVILDLGSIIAEWDENEQDLALLAIAGKLEYTAEIIRDHATVAE